MYEPKNYKVNESKEKIKKNNKANDSIKNDEDNIVNNTTENINNNSLAETIDKSTPQSILSNLVEKSKIIEKNTEEMNLKKNILDPLSVIIKLAILSKKQIGSKISVYNNVLYIQEVGIFQSFVRVMFKNNKVDIQYLYNPIYQACEKFLNKEFIASHPNIKNIFINAQLGLKSLIETYKEHMIITHTLYFYYNIIQNYLNVPFNEKLFIEDSFSNFYNKELLENLNSQWTNDKIKIVLEMIEFINGEKESNKSIKCLEEFMVIMDHNMSKFNF